MWLQSSLIKSDQPNVDQQCAEFHNLQNNGSTSFKLNNKSNLGYVKYAILTETCNCMSDYQVKSKNNNLTNNIEIQNINNSQIVEETSFP